MQKREWHYDTEPLFSLQKIVDGIDWISEVYVYGGYARALLGYPPFPKTRRNGRGESREKFGPGHDIDICFYVHRREAGEFVAQMRRNGIKLSTYVVVPPDETEDEYWEKIKRWIEEGITPHLLVCYLKEQHGKVGSHPLSWMTGDLHKLEVEGPTPTIRIKPKPIRKRLLEDWPEVAGSNPGNPGNPALVEPTEHPTLQSLFNLQDAMIEHKFPTDHIAEHEYQISNAGDIYRSMTESSPDPGYFGPKLDSISRYLDADNTGDFREYKQLMATPGYKPKRDKYMRNLAELKVLTVTSYIDLKRKDVMLDALELIRGIVLWFESGRVHDPPKRALEKLAGSLEKFFPAQVWEEPAATSNPGSNPRALNPSDPVIPYLAIPVACTVVLVVVSFVGWVASQLENN